MPAYYGRTGGTTTARTPAHRLLHRGRPVGLADPAAAARGIACRRAAARPSKGDIASARVRSPSTRGYRSGRETRSACCRSVRLEKFARVDRLAFHEHLVVEMRPRAATGAADEPDDVAFFHSLTHRDVDLLQVRVARLDAVAVVEDDVPPVPSARVRRDHDPRCGRPHRSAGRAADVDPLVVLPLPA